MGARLLEKGKEMKDGVGVSVEALAVGGVARWLLLDERMEEQVEGEGAVITSGRLHL